MSSSTQQSGAVSVQPQVETDTTSQTTAEPQVQSASSCTRAVNLVANAVLGSLLFVAIVVIIILVLVIKHHRKMMVWVPETKRGHVAMGVDLESALSESDNDGKVSEV
jgi:lipopolysaccharide/colanic/teichoic acid biosynthesis glycosyltransferase